MTGQKVHGEGAWRMCMGWFDISWNHSSILAMISMIWFYKSLNHDVISYIMKSWCDFKYEIRIWYLYVMWYDFICYVPSCKKKIGSVHGFDIISDSNPWLKCYEFNTFTTMPWYVPKLRIVLYIFYQLSWLISRARNCETV